MPSALDGFLRRTTFKYAATALLSGGLTKIIELLFMSLCCVFFFQALHNDLNLPISVLRVIYDMNDRNPDAVVKAILEK